MTSASERLAELGLTLPPVAAPVAAYIPAVRTGSHVYTSGQLPLVETILAVQANAPGLPVNVEVFSEALRSLPPDQAAARVAEATRSVLARLPG